MDGIDYTGPQGGLLALAFSAGATFAAGVMLLVGRFIWNTFVLKEREQCEERIRILETRINQLETVLIMFGPKAVSANLAAAATQRDATAPPDAPAAPSTLSTPASSD